MPGVLSLDVARTGVLPSEARNTGGRTGLDGPGIEFSSSLWSIFIMNFRKVLSEDDEKGPWGIFTWSSPDWEGDWKVFAQSR